MIYTNKMIDSINKDFYPKPGAKIARYISYEKLKSMLKTNSLYLSNVIKFMDEYEGEIPVSFFEKWKESSQDAYETIYKLKSKVYAAYISCWFSFEYESEPMWLAYGGNMKNNDGVCIITNVKKLEAYTNDLQSIICKVKYINENIDNVIEPPFYFSNCVEDNMPFSARVFHAYKTIEYCDEREIRAITYKKSKEEGLKIPICFNDFIDNIIINPHSTDEQRKKIKKLLEEYKMTCKIIPSKIKSRN